MREYDMIHTMLAAFAPETRSNPAFASDAEIFTVAGERWGISTDAFCEADDGFGTDAKHIGRNIAVAALCDLAASGCTPQFYLHALTLPENGDDFGVQLCAGVSDVLRAHGVIMLGGDLSFGKTWHCSATVLGQQKRPLSRVIHADHAALYVTGALGGANLAMLRNQPAPAFALRFPPAQSTACTDTSGGLMDAVFQLAGVNPGKLFRLHPASIPYARGIADSGFPAEAFLWGGAGEYVMLFTAPKGLTGENIFCIGEVATSNQPGVWFGERELTAPPPDPRSMNRADYMLAVLEAATGQ